MKRLLLLVSLLPSMLSAQRFHIREMRFIPNPRFFNTADTTIVYPVLATGDAAIDRAINNAIRQALMEDYDDSKTAREALGRWIGDGLTDMSYEVTYDKNGILSLLFDIGASAAYPTTWQTSLNFDLQTGHKLGLSDLVAEARLGPLKAKVLADKDDSLTRYKATDLRSRDLDTAVYAEAVDLVNDCAASLETDDFSITGDGIEILDSCEFPHVMRGMSPTYTLKYTFRYLQSYLKPEYQKRLPH